MTDKKIESLKSCWLCLLGKLVFMSVGISDPKQSQAGGLNKDLVVRGCVGGGVECVCVYCGGCGGLIGSYFSWTVMLEVHKNI